MVRSRVERSPAVRTPIVVVSSVEEAAEVAERVWLAPGILVLDGHQWSRPLSDLQRYQDPIHRSFDAPFSRYITPQEILDSFSSDLDNLFYRIFPNYEVLEIRKSWRPMVSGPEPLHYDTFEANGTSSVTSYLNVSPSPRHYGVSHDFATLLRLHRRYILNMKGAVRPIDHFCVRLRAMGTKGEGPLGRLCPRHFTWFASGSVWFFDPKFVSHELLYGDGAYCYSWRTPQRGKSTEEIFNEVIG